MTDVDGLTRYYEIKNVNIEASCKIFGRPIPKDYPDLNVLCQEQLLQDSVCLAGDNQHLEYYIANIPDQASCIHSALNFLKSSKMYKHFWRIACILYWGSILSILLDYLSLVIIFAVFGLIPTLFGIVYTRIWKRFVQYLPEFAEQGSIYKRFKLMAQGVSQNSIEKKLGSRHEEPSFSTEALKELQDLMSISDKIKIEDVCSILGVTRPILLRYLMNWKEKLSGFRIDGDYLIVENQKYTETFIDLLDERFDDWKKNKKESPKKD